jgi:hypothetical protein
MKTTICENCGNAYDKTFEIHTNGEVYVFDCFECAINMLAPICPHCDCKIIGHGVEEEGKIYCCAHCASESGAHMVKDRA